MGTYRLSDGTRLTTSQFEAKVRQAKKELLLKQLDDYGYNFCEDCYINANQMVPLDCSHEKSVDWCRKNGCSELGYSVENMKVRCRDCHQKKDRLNVQWKT